MVACRAASTARQATTATQPSPLLAHCEVMDAPAEAQVDLDAVRDNVTGLRKHVGTADLMAVVKSDAYGHGMIPVAKAALAGGAGWLGVVRVARGVHAARGRADGAGAVPDERAGRPA